ncbi:acyl-CoA carboxylase subunit epsilon [Nocardia suismassiliense]|uniref:acyl-CoA carboxylase subunit epsilon n=1 Tax=Nocardia suismassiliense TaxID=2077092 RepID=UPI000D1F406E|nr:acyl-CoA carboxylase subunit epsilon [Nocardia suismassiliense]
MTQHLALRIERGCPDDAEIAALTVVLVALQTSTVPLEISDPAPSWWRVGGDAPAAGSWSARQPPSWQAQH